MTRSDYIAALTEIRERVIDTAGAYDRCELTDATGMESDRREKMSKRLSDLVDRLFEEIAICEKIKADRAAIGEQMGIFDDETKDEEGGEE